MSNSLLDLLADWLARHPKWGRGLTVLLVALVVTRLRRRLGRSSSSSSSKSITSSSASLLPSAVAVVGAAGGGASGGGGPTTWPKPSGSTLTAAAAAAQVASAALPQTSSIASTTTSPLMVPFSSFLTAVERGEVGRVMFPANTDLVEFIPVQQADVKLVTRRVPSHLMPLVDVLRANKVAFEQVAPPPPSPTPVWQSVIVAALPLAYIGALGWLMYRFLGPDAQLGSGSNKVGDLAPKDGKNAVKFADVAGAEEARRAVKEVCEVLKDPERYKRAGARLPTGVLLVGPPGTGKTMLARAMAGEAGLPFFYCSGSDFVEVFTGRGAARVRALFDKAKKAAPAVIFIDEIDALGGARHSTGVSLTNNEEREQTLNQLLACMDGFDTDHRVVVMAATNRYESLDRALVRPGRFDRIVRVDLPDERGRLDILRVHTRGMRLGPDVDLARVARAAVGFTGAELAALANEAAIRAVRDDRELLCSADFGGALEAFFESRTGSSGSGGGGGGQGGQGRGSRQPPPGPSFGEALASMFRQSLGSSPPPPSSQNPYRQNSFQPNSQQEQNRVFEVSDDDEDEEEEDAPRQANAASRGQGKVAQQGGGGGGGAKETSRRNPPRPVRQDDHEDVD